jgi:hypothetical protein
LVVSQGSRAAQEELIGAVPSLLGYHAETGLADLLKLTQYRSLVDGRLSKRSRGGAGRKRGGLCASIASLDGRLAFPGEIWPAIGFAKPSLRNGAETKINTRLRTMHSLRVSRPLSLGIAEALPHHTTWESQSIAAAHAQMT